MITTIVGWDGTPAAESALEWAAAREEAGGRSLRVLRVAPAPDDELSAVDDTVLLRRLHHRLAWLRRVHPVLEVAGEIVHGEVVDRLCRAALDGSTLVVGEDRQVTGVLRSRRHIASRISTLARGTVIVVPLGGAVPTGSHRRVVVGIDGTQASLDALRFAAEAARERGARLVAVHTWAEPTVWDDIVSAPGELERLMVHEHEQLLEESVEVGMAEFPDVDVVRRVTRGGAASELRRLSRSADLLVVGDHGRSAVARHLLGSVSAALVLDPLVPTAVVHPAGRSLPDAHRASRESVEA